MPDMGIFCLTFSDNLHVVRFYLLAYPSVDTSADTCVDLVLHLRREEAQDMICSVAAFGTDY